MFWVTTGMAIVAVLPNADTMTSVPVVFGEKCIARQMPHAMHSVVIRPAKRMVVGTTNSLGTVEVVSVKNMMAGRASSVTSRSKIG